MPRNNAREFEEQTLALLRAQQKAYLDAVKAWRAALPPGGQAAWPEPPDLDTLPNAAVFAEASYAFAAKLLKEQSEFLASLSQAMAGDDDDR